MDYRSLLYERDDAYVTITLNRPERRNCLSSEMLTELEDAFRTTGTDSEVAGIVLAANGPVFSSGHDLGEMAKMNEGRTQGAVHAVHVGHDRDRGDSPGGGCSGACLGHCCGCATRG